MILRKLLSVSGSAIGQVGVFEDVAKEQGKARVGGHLGDGFAVEAEHVEAAQAGGQELAPTVLGEVFEDVVDQMFGKEGAFAAEFFGFGVHVVHEFVDEGDGDLLDLAFGVGHFADQNVAGGVDAALGFVV